MGTQAPERKGAARLISTDSVKHCQKGRQIRTKK